MCDKKRKIIKPAKKVFLSNPGEVPGSSSSKALGYELDGPSSIPGGERLEIFHSSVSILVLGSTQPPVKRVPWLFRGKDGQACCGCEYVDPASTSPMACNGDTFIFYQIQGEMDRVRGQDPD